jgi:SET domain-containing protein
MAKDNTKSSGTSAFNRRDENRRAGTPTSYGESPQRSSSSSATATATASPPPLTHEKIAERAKAIWRAKGCQSGHDRENWLEAEAQLRKELKIH